MDKALVQLEKLTFPLQVLFWHLMLQKQNLNLLYIFYQLVMLVHSLILWKLETLWNNVQCRQHKERSEERETEEENE